MLHRSHLFVLLIWNKTKDFRAITSCQNESHATSVPFQAATTHTYTHTYRAVCKVGLGMQKHARSVLMVLLWDYGGQRATNCATHGGQRRCGLLPEHWNTTWRSVRKDKWTPTSQLMTSTPVAKHMPHLNLGHREKERTAAAGPDVTCWGSYRWYLPVWSHVLVTHQISQIKQMSVPVRSNFAWWRSVAPCAT